MKGRSLYEGKTPFRMEFRNSGTYTLRFRDLGEEIRVYLQRGYKYLLTVKAPKPETLYLGNGKVIRIPGKTSIHILEPKGVNAEVLFKDKVIVSSEIPLKVPIKKEGIYKVRVGEELVSFEVKKGFEHRVYIKVKKSDTTETEDYRLIRVAGKTLLSIEQPKGFKVKVYKGRRLKFSGKIPIRRPVSEGLYRVLLLEGNKVVKRIKVKVVKGYTHILTIYYSPEKEEREAISEKNLQKLLKAISQEPFSDGKLDVLKTWAPKYWFLSSQAARIVSLYDFESDKIEAVKILYPRTLDKENFEEVIKVLTYSSSREEVRRWIREQR